MRNATWRRSARPPSRSASVFLRRTDLHNAIGWTIIGGGAIWFIAVQSAWFARKLNIGRVKAVTTAVWATLRAIAYLLLIVVPLALI